MLHYNLWDVGFNNAPFIFLLNLLLRHVYYNVRLPPLGTKLRLSSKLATIKTRSLNARHQIITFFCVSNPHCWTNRVYIVTFYSVFFLRFFFCSLKVRVSSFSRSSTFSRGGRVFLSNYRDFSRRANVIVLQQTDLLKLSLRWIACLQCYEK